VSSSEPLTYDRANRVQRALRRCGATRLGSWIFARILHRIDRPVHRLSGGRATLTSMITGLPVAMLTTTGARTGLARSMPLLGLPTAAGMAVIASNYGQARDPGWCHNLRSDPHATVTVAGQPRAVRAMEVDGPQRDDIWAAGLRIYPGWTAYERRAAGRRIPVFVLTPVPTPEER
jgi:deazaflavin-dependent oxidoreductase (nitroreductase family)